jgi:hypothetical protein
VCAQQHVTRRPHGEPAESVAKSCTRLVACRPIGPGRRRFSPTSPTSLEVTLATHCPKVKFPLTSPMKMLRVQVYLYFLMTDEKNL